MSVSRYKQKLSLRDVEDPECLASRPSFCTCEIRDRVLYKVNAIESVLTEWVRDGWRDDAEDQRRTTARCNTQG